MEEDEDFFDFDSLGLDPKELKKAKSCATKDMQSEKFAPVYTANTTNETNTNLDDI